MHPLIQSDINDLTDRDLRSILADDLAKDIVNVESNPQGTVKLFMWNRGVGEGAIYRPTRTTWTTDAFGPTKVFKQLPQIEECSLRALSYDMLARSNFIQHPEHAQHPWPRMFREARRMMGGIALGWIRTEFRNALHGIVYGGEPYGYPPAHTMKDDYLWGWANNDHARRMIDSRPIHIEGCMARIRAAHDEARRILVSMVFKTLDESMRLFAAPEGQGGPTQQEK